MGDDFRPVDQPDGVSAPSLHDGGQETARAPVSIARLVRNHHREIYRYAYRLTGTVADAEDLSQQTFLIAQQKIDQLRDPAKANRWLMAVARNCFLKSLRRRRPSPAANLDMDMEEVGIVQPPETQEVDSELLQAALNELPDQHRLILVMFYFDELSYKEIASELDVPMGTVMSRLARAKTRLRESLVTRRKPV